MNIAGVAEADEYGHQVEGSPKFRQFIFDSIDGSLKRVGTDHFDILLCPHGADIAFVHGHDDRLRGETVERPCRQTAAGRARRSR